MQQYCEWVLKDRTNPRINSKGSNPFFTTTYFGNFSVVLCQKFSHDLTLKVIISKALRSSKSWPWIVSCISTLSNKENTLRTAIDAKDIKENHSAESITYFLHYIQYNFLRNSRGLCCRAWSENKKTVFLYVSVCHFCFFFHLSCYWGYEKMQL